MRNNNYIKMECFEVKQPIGTFYVGKMNYNDLLDISYSDIRRIEREEKNDYETYFGIQRSLARKRIIEISQYVRNIDATFPSSILLAIKSIDIASEGVFDNVSYDKTNKILSIKRDKDIAHIIDGQHRVFGLKHAVEEMGLFDQKFNFELIVTIFIDMDIDDQAMIFSTINKAQTKVNKSLVYDLYDLAKTRSPQRTAHNIIRLLNEKEGSPFKDRIKMLGVADDTAKETITQATLVELTMRYISKNPMKDRDDLKRGKRITLVTDNERDKLFLRNWFVDEKDEYIAKLLWNYFTAVEKKWSKAWNDNSKILSKSTGVIALMRFLKDVVLELGVERMIQVYEFEQIFKPIRIKDDDFTNVRYISGGVGQSALYNDLKQEAHLK